jgi:hypothetical protein
MPRGRRRGRSDLITATNAPKHKVRRLAMKLLYGKHLLTAAGQYLNIPFSLYKGEKGRYITVRGVINLQPETMPRGERRGRSVLTTYCDVTKKRFVYFDSRSSMSDTNL